MKNKKLPSIGEIWISEKGYEIQVTDVAKKKNKDQIRLYDEYWNTAPVGQMFIYAINKSNYSFTSGKIKLEEFLEEYTFHKKLKKCSCPDCDKYHHQW